MTARRQAIIADYDDEITTLYETVHAMVTQDFPPHTRDRAGPSAAEKVILVPGHYSDQQKLPWEKWS
jgi:hypothetical protein